MSRVAARTPSETETDPPESNDSPAPSAVSEGTPREEASAPGADDGTSPPESAPGDAPPETPQNDDVPAFIIMCPHCQTSVPFVPGIEGFEPSMSKVFSTCPDCEGFGDVKTGSLLAAHATRKCDTCKGVGYVGPEGTAPTVELPPSEPPWAGAVWNPEINSWS